MANGAARGNYESDFHRLRFRAVILLLNGAFGIGKTTVARTLRARVPRSVIVDPELIGIPLQRLAAIAGGRPTDFQDLRAWRTLTIAAIRCARVLRPTVIVPMAISNPAHLDEIRAGVERPHENVVHVCLIATVEVVHDRLRARGADPDRNAWEFRRAAECCAVHGGPAFAVHIDAATTTPGDIATAIISAHLDSPRAARTR